MRLLLVFIGVFLLCNIGYAQLQNNVWTFGDSTGLSFNTNPPTTVATNMKTYETAACISNRHTGALMFYTDGLMVWDANNNPMPNGSGVGIDKHRTTAQGAVFVPFADDSNKFYLFTMSSYIQSGALQYSVIDRTLNGGMGDVVTGQKAIVIDDGFTEAMTVVEYCDVYWLIVVKRYSRDFYAYKITDTGIVTTPIISTVAYSQMPRTIANIKVSPNRKRFVISVRGSATNTTYLGLHDFDGKTGKLSNGMVVDEISGIEFYGCEFSPNSKLLYAVASVTGKIYQYDATLANGAAITASRSILKAGFGQVGSIQLAPDSNIYVCQSDSATIDRIENCDALYPNCIYRARAITLTKGTMGYSFPQAVTNIATTTDQVTTRSDTVLCNGKELKLVALPNQESYTWQDGSTQPIFTVNTNGVYWVKSTGRCNTRVDSIVVDEVTVEVVINNDTTICIGDELTLRSNAQPSGTNFTWSNGSTADTIVIKQSGRYQLKATYKGCSDTDEVIVTHYPRINIELGNDTQICKGNAFMLPQIESSDFDAKYLWQDGSTGRTFEVTQAGKYQVTLSNQCQTVKDSVIVTGRNCHFFFPSGFTPNGDGRNDIARLVGDVGAVQDFTLRIFNRWGELVYLTDNPTLGWDGNYKNQKAEVGVYYYQIQYTYLGEKELMKGDLMLVR